MARVQADERSAPGPACGSFRRVNLGLERNLSRMSYKLRGISGFATHLEELRWIWD